jgi:hypothetical protein
MHTGIVILARLLALIFCAVSLFHIAWALGIRIGGAHALPERPDGSLALRALGEFRYIGFFKRVRGTPFARMDSRYYSPLALLLGVGTAILASGGW